MTKIIQGCDVSGWNIVKDYNKLTTHCDFVYVKSSQGVNVNTGFKDKWSNLRGKTYRGIYHFLDFKNGSGLTWGKQQADEVFSLVKDDMPELPIWLDFENNEGDLTWPKITVGFLGNIGKFTPIALGFKQEWELLTGKKCGIYTRKEFADYMQNFTDGILAIAMYPNAFLKTPDFITDFQGITPKASTGKWANWTFWQYASQALGSNFGTDSATDLDVFNGTEEDWSVFVGKQLPTTYPSIPEDVPVVTTPNYTTAIVMSVANVRNGVGTNNPQWSINGVAFTLPVNTKLQILELKYDTNKNPWIRIGYNQWVCSNFNGMELVKLS